MLTYCVSLEYDTGADEHRQIEWDAMINEARARDKNIFIRAGFPAFYHRMEKVISGALFLSYFGRGLLLYLE